MEDELLDETQETEPLMTYELENTCTGISDAGNGYKAEYTISVTMGVIVNFIMNYILIKKYAAIGASIATVVSQLVVDIWQIYYIRKEIRLKTMFSTVPKYLFAGLIMYGVCQATKYIINTGLESIFLQIGVGVSIYMITLFIFRDEYLYTVLDKIIGKKGKREKA